MIYSLLLFSGKIFKVLLLFYYHKIFIVSYLSTLVYLLQLMSVVDPKWETVDPNPDVQALFLQFNDTYFWGKLLCIEVKWSPRMTLYVQFFHCQLITCTYIYFIIYVMS